MSVSYELLFLYNIPFLTRVGDTDKTHKLYYYDAKHIGNGTEPIAIGVWNADDRSIKLDEGWKLRLQPRVDAWKGTLTSSERGIIQPRAPKPSKPKRTSPKSTNTSTTATTTTATTTASTSGASTPPNTGEELCSTETSNTNIVIVPETVSSPPNPKGRRRVIRANAKASS